MTKKYIQPVNINSTAHGFRKMYRLTAAATIFFCLLGSPVLAEEQEEMAPSMELLEFLGDWSVDDGEWLDLVELEKINLPEQEYEKDDTKK